MWGPREVKEKGCSLLSKLKSGIMTLNKFFESELYLNWFKVYILDNYGGWQKKKANMITIQDKASDKSID